MSGGDIKERGKWRKKNKFGNAEWNDMIIDSLNYQNK